MSSIIDEELARQGLAPAAGAPAGAAAGQADALDTGLGYVAGIGLPVLGTALGTAIAPGVGTVIGSAIGAGLGETFRQRLHKEPFSGKDLALQTALGVVPATTLGKAASVAPTLTRRLGLLAAEGVAQGVGGEVARHAIDQDPVTGAWTPRLPTLSEAGTAAGYGAILGPGLGHWFMPKIKKAGPNAGAEPIHITDPEFHVDPDDPDAGFVIHDEPAPIEVDPNDPGAGLEFEEPAPIEVDPNDPDAGLAIEVDPNDPNSGFTLGAAPAAVQASALGGPPVAARPPLRTTPRMKIGRVNQPLPVSPPTPGFDAFAARWANKPSTRPVPPPTTPAPVAARPPLRTTSRMKIGRVNPQLPVSSEFAPEPGAPFFPEAGEPFTPEAGEPFTPSLLDAVVADVTGEIGEKAQTGAMKRLGAGINRLVEGGQITPEEAASVYLRGAEATGVATTRMKASRRRFAEMRAAAEQPFQPEPAAPFEPEAGTPFTPDQPEPFVPGGRRSRRPPPPIEEAPPPPPPREPPPSGEFIPEEGAPFPIEEPGPFAVDEGEPFKLGGRRLRGEPRSDRPAVPPGTARTTQEMRAELIAAGKLEPPGRLAKGKYPTAQQIRRLYGEHVREARARAAQPEPGATPIAPETVAQPEVVEPEALPAEPEALPQAAEEAAPPYNELEDFRADVEAGMSMAGLREKYDLPRGVRTPGGAYIFLQKRASQGGAGARMADAAARPYTPEPTEPDVAGPPPDVLDQGPIPVDESGAENAPKERATEARPPRDEGVQADLIEDMTARGFDAERIAVELGVPPAEVLTVREARGIPEKRILAPDGSVIANPEYQRWVRNRKPVAPEPVRSVEPVGLDLEGAAASRERQQASRAAEAAAKERELEKKRAKGTVPREDLDRPLEPHQEQALTEFIEKHPNAIGDAAGRAWYRHRNTGIDRGDVEDLLTREVMRVASRWDPTIGKLENYFFGGGAGGRLANRAKDFAVELAKKAKFEVPLDATRTSRLAEGPPGAKGSAKLEAEATKAAAAISAPAVAEAPTPETPKAKPPLTRKEQAKIIKDHPIMMGDTVRDRYLEYLKLLEEGKVEPAHIVNTLAAKYKVSDSAIMTSLNQAEELIYRKAGRPGEGPRAMTRAVKAEAKGEKAAARAKLGPVERPALPAKGEDQAAWAKANEQQLRTWLKTNNSFQELLSFADALGHDLRGKKYGAETGGRALLRRLTLDSPLKPRGGGGGTASFLGLGELPEIAAGWYKKLRGAPPADTGQQHAHVQTKGAVDIAEETVAKHPPKPVRTTVKASPELSESVLREKTVGPVTPRGKPAPRPGENYIEAVVNTQRLDLPDDTKADLIQLGKVIEPTLSRAFRRTFGDIKKDAAAIFENVSEGEFLEKARKLLGHQNLTAEQGLAVRQLFVGQAKRLRQAKYDAIAAKGTAGEGAALDAFNQELLRTASIQSIVANDGTGLGRAMAARRILAQELDPNMTRRGKFAAALRAADVDKETVAAIGTKYDDVIAGKASQDELRKMVQDALNKDMTGFRKFLTLYKAGLLSPPSLVANFASNLGHYAITGAEQRMAAGFDAVRSKLTGTDREVYALPMDLEVDQLWRALAGDGEGQGAVGKLWQDHLDILAARPLKRDLMSEAALQDVRRFGPAFQGKKGEFADSMFKALDSGDTFFKHLIRQRKLTERALLHARRGDPTLMGAALKKRVHEIELDMVNAAVSDHPKHKLYKEDWSRINNAMKEGTFQTELTGGKFRGAAAKWNEMVQAVPILQLITPFVKTPANIAAESVARTPLGLLTLRKHWKAVQKGEMSLGEFQEKVAKPVVGSTAMGLIYMMAQNDQITGGGPDDPKKQQALKATGWQPYSVKVGDKYVSYQRFEPIATVMGFASDMAEATKAGDLDTAGKIGTKLFASISENLVNKTFLAGLEGLSTAFSDPKRYGDRYIKQLQGSLVPNTIGYLPFGHLARSLDPTYRQTEAGALSTFQAKIPGLSQMLPEQPTPTGEARQRAETLGPRLLSPIAMSEEKHTPEAELARTMMSSGYVPSLPPRSRDIGGKRLEFTPDERKRLAGAQREASEFIQKRLIKDPTFQRLPDNENDPRFKRGMKTKADVMEKIYRRYRRSELLRMRGQQVKRALAEDAAIDMAPESDES
jgi:hypothetical protein